MDMMPILTAGFTGITYMQVLLNGTTGATANQAELITALHNYLVKDGGVERRMRDRLLPLGSDISLSCKLPFPLEIANERRKDGHLSGIPECQLKDVSFSRANFYVTMEHQDKKIETRTKTRQTLSDMPKV